MIFHLRTAPTVADQFVVRGDGLEQQNIGHMMKPSTSLWMYTDLCLFTVQYSVYSVTREFREGWICTSAVERASRCGGFEVGSTLLTTLFGLFRQKPHAAGFWCASQFFFFFWQSYITSPKKKAVWFPMFSSQNKRKRITAEQSWSLCCRQNELPNRLKHVSIHFVFLNASFCNP